MEPNLSHVLNNINYESLAQSVSVPIGVKQSVELSLAHISGNINYESLTTVIISTVSSKSNINSIAPEEQVIVSNFDIVNTITNSESVSSEELVSEVPISDWKAVRTAKADPDSIIACSNCGKETSVHPNYTAAGISGCAGKNRCNKTEDIVYIMLKFREWIFVEFDYRTAKQLKIHYRRPGSDHICKVNWETLRKGGQCKKCVDQSQRKTKEIKEIIIRASCYCSEGGKRPPVCFHHNYLMRWPESASEWDYELNNGLRPEQVAPGTKIRGWFRCPNEWCLMAYEQHLHARTHPRQRCPYCSGHQVCEWNSLEANYPELAKEVDLSSPIKAYQVTPGSDIILRWFCDKHPEGIFRWEAKASSRTSRETGCPQCYKSGHETRRGGHDAFIALAASIHNARYQYPEKYKGYRMPITIYCPIISKNTTEPHGNFILTPNCHIHSQTGCPICSSEQTKSRYVRRLEAVLDLLGYKESIDYKYEHKLDGLVYKAQLKLDLRFSKPREKLAMEVDGEDHFIPRRACKDCLTDVQTRDIVKDLYVLKQGMSMFRLPHNLIPTTEMVSRVMNLYHTHKQIYITYQHYLDEVSKYMNMESIYIVILEPPKGTQVRQIDFK